MSSGEEKKGRRRGYLVREISRHRKNLKKITTVLVVVVLYLTTSIARGSAISSIISHTMCYCPRSSSERDLNYVSSSPPSPSSSSTSFLFLPGISEPSPKPTPAFLRSSSMFTSPSSAHSNTRWRPSKCVCLSALYAFSASCRVTNSRNAKPRERRSKRFGKRTDLS